MLFRSFVFYFLAIFTFNIFAQEDNFKVLEEKVYKVIDQIEKSELVFIRNDDEHTSKEAAAHIKRKYEFAIRSPFTPSKKNWTLDFFIKNIASKSSSSGNPYYVRDKDGRKIEMETWINTLVTK